VELNRNTVSLFYKKLRLIIEHHVELEAEVEVDESVILEDTAKARETEELAVK